MEVERRTAVFLAHPGHELPIHGWLERHRPTVHILTDGSGRAGQSRIGSTRRILDNLETRAGELFGDHTDLGIYQAVLGGHRDFFLKLAERMAQSLIRHRIERVVGDAEEYEIMAHDVFRFVRLRAVQIAELSLGWKIEHFEFLIDSNPDSRVVQFGERTVCLDLDSEAFARKLSSAHRYKEVQEFVVAALEASGAGAFVKEYLYPVPATVTPARLDFVPVYEQHGERLVEAGLYPEVVRYHEHVLPLAEQLLSGCEHRKVA